MKNLITLLFLLPISLLAQLPYSWLPNTNPGWSSNSINGSALNWQPGCNTVTTNCSGNYGNSWNSTYTSPIINASCSNASTIAVTFTASGNAEYTYDFLFIEYSIDNGATWINPYGAGIGWTGNFGSGTTIPPIILPTYSNIRFRFRFQSDNIFTYSGYKITDFDIVCNVVLPIELVSFTGTKGNTLTWEVESEVNCKNYIVERSTNGAEWITIANLEALGAYSYSLKDVDFENVINYYRLSQIDNDGGIRIYEDEIVAIDNRVKAMKIVNLTNTLGQKVDENATGVVIVTYEDGTSIKEFR